MLDSIQPAAAGEVLLGPPSDSTHQPASTAPQAPLRGLGSRSTLGIADGDPPFLRALNRARGTHALRCYDSAAGVMEAGARARAAASTPPWDAVIVSLGLPDLHGNAVIAQLRHWFPQLVIWAAIGMEESHSLIGAVCAGADGYLVKSGKPDQDRSGLLALDARRPPFSRSMAVSLLQLAGDPAWNRRGHTPAGLPPRLGLSRQQLQLLQLVARGDAVPAAAERMALAADGAWLVLCEIYGQLRRAPLCTAVPQALRLQVLAQLSSR